jgi:hypothetical protein
LDPLDSVRAPLSPEQAGAASEEVAPVDGLAAPEVYVRRPAEAPPAVQPPAPAEGDAVEAPREAQEAPHEAPDRPAASTVDMGLLHSQVVRARKAGGQARRQLADEINAAFRKLGQSGGSRAVADFLLKQLEEDAFEGLTDSEGRTCRGVAVEALLAMGYPYALEISPEDLEHLRQDSSPNPLGAYGVAGLLLALVGGGAEIFQVMEPGSFSDGALLAAVIHVGAMLVTALWGGVGRRGTDGWQVALTLLVVVGLGAVPLYLAGVAPAAVGGVCALISAMVLSRRT